jgi:SLT domain-containing protein
LIAFSGSTDNGFVHIANTVVNIIHAAMRFIKTHHAKINNLFQNLAVINQSFAKKSFVSCGSSHFNLQNHHKGIRFNVYSVHFLSL